MALPGRHARQAIGLPPRSARRWSLVEKPPRLRPSASVAAPVWRPGGVLVRPDRRPVHEVQRPVQPPAASASAWRAASTRSQTPARRQRRKRLVHRLPGAVPLGQVAPRGAGAQRPQDGVDDRAVVLGGAARSGGFCGGSRGRSRSHCASVSSPRCPVHPAYTEFADTDYVFAGRRASHPMPGTLGGEIMPSRPIPASTSIGLE